MKNVGRYILNGFLIIVGTLAGLFALMVFIIDPLFKPGDAPNSADANSNISSTASSAPASIPNTPVTAPPTVPAFLRGIWSVDCTGAATGTSQFGFDAYGPNLDDSVIPSLGPSASKVIDVVQQNGGFAIAEDGAYDPNDSSTTPNITISVFQILSDTQIELFSVYNTAAGVGPGTNNVITKCSQNSAFSDAIQNVSTSSAPTQAEIGASNAAFAAMPPIMGVKWTP